MQISLELLFQIINTFLVMFVPIILILIFIVIYTTIRNKFTKRR